eukprot:2696814-Pyramimonas_sp.AAC.1
MKYGCQYYGRRFSWLSRRSRSLCVGGLGNEDVYPALAWHRWSVGRPTQSGRGPQGSSSRGLERIGARAVLRDAPSASFCERVRCLRWIAVSVYHATPFVLLQRFRVGWGPKASPLIVRCTGGGASRGQALAYIGECTGGVVPGNPESLAFTGAAW